MKPVFVTSLCILILGVEPQLHFPESRPYDQQYNQQYTERSSVVYPANNVQNITPYTANINTIGPESFQYRSNTADRAKLTERDSYLQAISRNDNAPQQQFPNQEKVQNDERIHFIQPTEDLSPPPFENADPNYYSTQQSHANNPLSTPGQGNFEAVQQNPMSGTDSVLKTVTFAVSNFGLRLIKTISQLKSGNVIVSPTSIATVLALLQQGATGQAQEQITRSLGLNPDASKTIFSVITANMTKRNSRSVLSTANNLYVSDAFELNDAFKRLAIKNFWSEVTPTNFANPFDAVQRINTWVASKTNNKITNLLQPGAVSPATQLVLLNAVYFKGIWETRFKPERTQNDVFHLSSGEKKTVPFMHTRHSFQAGYDPSTRALVSILPFEGHQYSLILILPKKSDNVANVLSTLTTDQLLYYQTFNKLEISIDIPKFTLKTDTDLNPVLRNMGITNIFGARSELTGVGLYRSFPPQISNAVHSGYLSVDEQGVTAAASTALVAIALSYDDSSITFRADRPFIAVLWDRQLSIPIFIAKIEDPS